MQVFNLKRGNIPLLISIPHMGTCVPPDIDATLTPEAKTLADTDWHLDLLYDFADKLGASVIQANYSRYVIDLNRPSTDESLYPGQTTTSLCSTTTFHGEAVYVAGAEPDAAAIAARIARYWQPYHDALAAEIAHLHAQHGQVLLWEAHSISSVLPRLFDGKLPDFNIGTNQGLSCSQAVAGAVAAATEKACADQFSWVVNGRFKGGYITRHYARPDDHIHAVQLEMCQSLYMDEQAPFAYRPDLGAQAAPIVATMMQAALSALGKQ